SQHPEDDQECGGATAAACEGATAGSPPPAAAAAPPPRLAPGEEELLLRRAAAAAAAEVDHIVEAARKEWRDLAQEVRDLSGMLSASVAAPRRASEAPAAMGCGPPGSPK
ncbi:unnamed protein product, partial [Prorocentrum cordatum]